MTVVQISDGSAVVFKHDLMSLKADGLPCEICNNKMMMHDWVIMDSYGSVVVGCSFKMEQT